MPSIGKSCNVSEHIVGLLMGVAFCSWRLLSPLSLLFSQRGILSDRISGFAFANDFGGSSLYLPLQDCHLLEAKMLASRQLLKFALSPYLALHYGLVHLVSPIHLSTIHFPSLDPTVRINKS